MINVVFVCMGNICRSPMAEAVFIDLVEKAGLSDKFRIDSAGTIGYHVGEPAHRGTQQVLAKNGIKFQGTSRQFHINDFSAFDYVIAMDGDNLNDLQRLASHADDDTTQVALLLDFADHATEREVPDPYYTGSFDYVYDLVLDGCEGLLAHIRKEHNL